MQSIGMNSLGLACLQDTVPQRPLDRLHTCQSTHLLAVGGGLNPFIPHARFSYYAYHQHGWGLPEGVEPPIIRNSFPSWLLLPLAPSAIPMRVSTVA